MEKKKLAIIIPTCNRLGCIRYYLETQLERFREYGVDVILYDSSDDDGVLNCADTFCRSGFQNLIYKRYEEAGNVRAIDDKVFSACRELHGQYEYIWFSSDGTVFQIDSIWPSVSRGMEQGRDLLVLNHAHSSNIADRTYTDSRALLQDCGWILTMLGTGIVSARLIRETVERFPVTSRTDFWLWYPLAYFYTLAGRPVDAVWLGCQTPYRENPFRTDAFWKLNGDALWQWGKVWVESIEALPAFYDDVKAGVIRSWDAHTRLFSIKGLMGMRAQGQITHSDVVRYRAYIKKITDTKAVWFYIITLPGARTLLSWVRRMYRAIQKKGRERQ